MAEDDKNFQYPEWKILAWRYVRVFTASFLGVFSIDQFLLGGGAIEETLLKSAVAAGISAIFKAFRDEVSDGDNSHRVDKIPL